MVCCNWNCEGHTWNDHIRCGNCRRYNISMCVDCDTEIDGRGAFYCKPCRDNHTAAKLQTYFLRHLGEYPDCLMCGVELPSRKIYTCRGDCHKLYKQLDFIVRRGNTKVNDYYILERQ
jgi:hypothetical protein